MERSKQEWIAKFARPQDLDLIVFFFLDLYNIEITMSTEFLKVKKECVDFVCLVLSTLGVRFGPIELNEDGIVTMPLNVILLSRILHFLHLLFPLYTYDFNEENKDFLRVWQRARGHRLNGFLDEPYRCALYEWALSNGNPVARGLTNGA